MNWVNLQKSYLLGAYKGAAETESAKQRMLAEGREVVYAQRRSQVQEQAARRWVHRPLDRPDMFLDYTFSPARGCCPTARESLDTAVELLYQRRQAEYPYIVIIKL